MKVVLATRNAGKLVEMQRLFEPIGWTLVSQEALDVPSAPETKPTFIENALDKARHVAEATGLPCIADDSGIVVEALGGAPGIYSARYAGPQRSDKDNNAKLVAELAGVDDRRAHFYCAMVFVPHANHPAPTIATAAWHGEIVDEAQGDGGFGYDPHFYLPEFGKTSAALDAATKNRLSHRGQAAAELLRKLT